MDQEFRVILRIRVGGLDRPLTEAGMKRLLANLRLDDPKRVLPGPAVITIADVLDDTKEEK